MIVTKETLFEVKRVIHSSRQKSIWLGVCKACGSEAYAAELELSLSPCKTWAVETCPVCLEHNAMRFSPTSLPDPSVPQKPQPTGGRLIRGDVDPGQVKF